jgi:formylglycine-generating enzyme required for sulfatase activity
MDLEGTIVGQYRIIEQIGRGRMSTVYKAYQPNLDRHVAVKVLAPDLAETEGFILRFEREAKAVAKLRHRNILTVFDYGRQGDVFYLVTEYVGGGTLRGYLGWPQDLAYAASIVSQVGDALAHAHEQGMIHRDVKPGNILMADDNWPLLSDFGLVKMVEDSRQLTASGASVGTPQYMSPEQAQGLAVDRRSDIYSLGALLYEAVTGQPPFTTDSPVAVILRHINEPLTPPRALRPDLSQEMGHVICKALAKSPADRYQRMEDFLADLQEVCPLPANGNLVYRSNAQAGPQGPPPASSVAPTPVIKPRPPRRRPFSCARVTIGVLLLLTLALTFLLVRTSTTLSIPTFLTTDTIATVSSLSTSLSIGPSSSAPSPAVASSPSPIVTPSPSPTVAPSPSPTVRPSPSPTPAPSPSPTAAPSPSPTVVPTVPTPRKIETQVWEADGAEMVFVPAGEFIMGSEELGDDERPARRVHLDDFWIDRYEVTNERFARFVAATGYQTEAEGRGWGWVWKDSGWERVEGADWRHPHGADSGIEGKADSPVVLVSWNDAHAYCRWAGKRLPSEAQWEKAARGPATDSGRGRRYTWGDEFDSGRANTGESQRGDTTPVGSFSPRGDSPYGASDMTGNVWEWVADWYDGDYYSQAPSTNPPGPASGVYKVLRGGSWPFDEVYARTSFRYNVKPDYTYDFAGFRCSSQ